MFSPPHSLALHHDPPRPASSSNSLSSSVVTVTRAASVRDGPELQTSRPSSRPTPPPAQSARRASVAHVAHDSIGSIREGIGNLNRWSQSTGSSSKSTVTDKDRRPSFARRLSISQSPSFTSLHGSSAQQSSPPRKSTTNPRRSSHERPRRARPHSPAADPSRAVTTALPPISTLPLLPLLAPTVYDPNAISPNSSAVNTPSPAGLFTPNTHTSTDYFGSRACSTSQNAKRPPSRNRLGQSPLESPSVGVLEAEARYKASTTSRPTTSSGKESAQRSGSAAPRDKRAGSQDTVPRDRRAGSQDVDTHRRTRSRSDASSRPGDGSTSTPPRQRERREKDKKTMLSRALQKANTAVLLDNAQNFEGAMEAYEDACKLLQQVMMRSSGEEDRRKLDAIRVTYTNRIEELRRLDPAYQSAGGKSLPARPMSNESLSTESQSIILSSLEDDDPPVIQTATMTRIVNDRSMDASPDRRPQQSQELPFRKSPGLRESVFTSAMREVESTIPSSTFLLQLPAGMENHIRIPERNSSLESPMDRSYMPPPLSPRRPISPNLSPKNDEHTGPRLLSPGSNPPPNHTRAASSESMSWLDTIDESGGSSCSSSVHSLSSGAGLRRKHIRTGSGATEAEFDAALDAAVEAAYDDGLEPYEDDEDDDDHQPLQMDIATRLRNVELAKERVREVEREEAISAAIYRYRETRLRNDSLPHVRESAEFNFQGDDAEEEERMLDEMTEYMLDGFDFGLQTKSSLPRQSDSSGFSGSTWNSSMSSNRTTAGTSLSTVAEVNHPSRFSQKPPTHQPPPVPPPTGALPLISDAPLSKTPATTSESAFTRPPSMSGNVRNRRLSGQNAKQLKIETSLASVHPPPLTEKPSATSDKESRPEMPPVPKSANATLNGSQTLADSTFKVPGLPASVSQPSGLSAPSPVPPVPSSADTTFTVSPATPALTQMISNDSTLVPSSPKYAGKPPAAGIRKNKSSLSLKARTLSMSSPDGSDVSVGTPLSTTFSFTTRKQSQSNVALQTVPTPSVPTFNVEGLPTGGMHLFESDIHSPYSPGSPNTMAVNAPIPLEPCPDSYLLRPFWLMRCFYQTIAHPRGGYISTKLFIPRDVWRVKGVKLKNIDEKTANCDLLTEALQRLAEVDTLDADAVYEEMSSFEAIMDQVQVQLAKKLGSEVGTNGISALFKDATMVGTGAAAADGTTGTNSGSHNSNEAPPKSAVAQGKSFVTSWRKLRSKSSAVGLSSMVTGKGAGGEVPKDTLTMPTLPMTSLPKIRTAKRDVASVVCDGPNRGYMQSLARLFDAVQILDQIARQVEDPGLRHSSSTHVGLELSTRHAAEFFGFYICRFVLQDLTSLLDKFIKRGSEWVLV